MSIRESLWSVKVIRCRRRTARKFPGDRPPVQGNEGEGNNTGELAGLFGQPDGFGDNSDVEQGTFEGIFSIIVTFWNTLLKTTDESNKILWCQMQQPLSVKDSSNAEYRHNSICMTV